MSIFKKMTFKPFIFMYMKIKFIIFFFFFFTNIAFCQQHNTSVKVTYNLKYLTDTTVDVYTYEPAELIVIGNTSSFMTTKLAVSDSINYFQMNESKHIRGKSVKLRVIKDFVDNSIMHYEELIPRDFLYSEDKISDLDWNISDLIDTIFGYNCQLATLNYGGRIWKAWFTTMIPIPDGPYKFSGLPGLIIKIHDDKNQWVMDFVSIENHQVAEFNFFYLKNAQKYKVIDFYKEKKSFMENYFERLEAAGTLSFPKESRTELIKQSKENIKKDNNWIELYH